MSDLKRADQRLLPVGRWCGGIDRNAMLNGLQLLVLSVLVAHPPTDCVVSSFVQVSAAHDVEPPVEDDVSGLCLRPHVAFCASVCV